MRDDRARTYSRRPMDPDDSCQGDRVSRSRAPAPGRWGQNPDLPRRFPRSIAGSCTGRAAIDFRFPNSSAPCIVYAPPSTSIRPQAANTRTRLEMRTNVLTAAVVAAALFGLTGCGEGDASPTAAPSFATSETSSLAAEVRTLAAGRGIGPLTRPAPVRPALVRLGQALAFDKILSGNRDISCMTCHLPSLRHRRRPEPFHRPGGHGARSRAGPSERRRSSPATRRRCSTCSPISRCSGTAG